MSTADLPLRGESLFVYSRPPSSREVLSEAKRKEFPSKVEIDKARLAEAAPPYAEQQHRNRSAQHRRPANRQCARGQPAANVLPVFRRSSETAASSRTPTAKIRASSGEMPRLSSRTCAHSGRAKTPPIIRTASPAVAQRSKNQPMLMITNVRSTRNAWKPREAVSRAQRSFIRLYRRLQQRRHRQNHAVV